MTQRITEVSPRFLAFCCMLVGYIIYKSTFLPRILGVLEVVAGVGYSTYLWPPLANYLYLYNLALGGRRAVAGAVAPGVRRQR